MHNHSIKKTLGVALSVCLVCSILVSSAAVLLKSRQKENQRLEKIRNILSAGDLYTEKMEMESIFNRRINSIIINMKTGEHLPKNKYNDVLNIDKFNIKNFARDDEYGRSISEENDIARIRRMPKYMIVYKVKEGDSFNRIILPIYGKGLWSTMYGFIALDKDLKTIKGFTFYEHGETPGLGGEVDNALWKKLWVGKQAYDLEGNVIIHVIKGKVDFEDPNADHMIDGLSGSTLTTRGVNNLVRFWLGSEGYGPYIRQLRERDRR